MITNIRETKGRHTTVATTTHQIASETPNVQTQGNVVHTENIEAQFLRFMYALIFERNFERVVAMSVYPHCVYPVTIWLQHHSWILPTQFGM